MEQDLLALLDGFPGLIEMDFRNGRPAWDQDRPVELDPQKNTVRLNRHTDMPARGWYSGDDHTHARLMSSEDGEKLLTMARAADIHVCNVLEMGDWMRSFYPQRGFGKEFRVSSGNYWIVPGIEDPRSLLGHAIGLNLTSRVRDLSRHLLNDWWGGGIHKQGGLYGHTHVGQKACLVEREMADLLGARCAQVRL